MPLAAAVLLLIPIWGFPYFLTQDGPTHVENAKILLDYGKPAFEELRVFYVLNIDAFPNWFSHLALAGLMTIVGPLLAEKLLLSAYVLVLPWAFRYTLGGLRAEAVHLWPLILPFVYNHFLHLGFYNLAFAAIPFFVILGWWMRRSGRLGPGETAALGSLLLFLYFCHLVTLLLVLAGIWSLRRIPLDALPDISDVQVIIHTPWAGQPPSLIEDQVTYPIVTKLLAAPHVKAVRAQTMFGDSYVFVVFEDGTAVREHWDGLDRWKRFEYTGAQRVEWAIVDPDATMPLDIDRLPSTTL